MLIVIFMLINMEKPHAKNENEKPTEKFGF
jgi:hypothetical protein